MGPLIVLDKSALQSLSREEMGMLAKHYLLVVPPVLLVEILADLKKDPREGRIPNSDVIWLAGQLLSSYSKINVPYRAAVAESMLGNDPAPGFVLMAGAQDIRTKDGQRITFFDAQWEYEVLGNWHAGRFNEAERALAEEWRRVTREFDLESFRRIWAGRLKGKPTPQSLDDLVPVVDAFLASEDPSTQKDLISEFLDSIAAPVELKNMIFERWLGLRMPPLNEFSRYGHYCFRTMLIFWSGLAFGLVSTRSTNLIDLEYFLYAHFAYAFCSNDRFHEGLSPYILGRFHTFVKADILKQDLKWLKDEWDSLSESQKEDRAYNYGSYPPQNPASITHQLWTKYMAPWQPGSGNRAIRMTEEQQEEVLAKLRPLMEAIDRQG
jgi:hypothetical protein